MTTVEATLTHASRGKPGSATCCMLALAIRERVRPETTVVVQVGSTLDGVAGFFRAGNLIRVVELPYEASSMARRFDAGEPIDPVAFELDIPAELLREVPA